MRRALMALAMVTALAAGGVPAAAAEENVPAVVAGESVPASVAGAWAVTYLDPSPPRFEGGDSYTLGFWVLQHGTHPFEGLMNPVALRFTSSDGTSLTFDGKALPEAAHYATAVALPEGAWKVEAVQGPFQPYEVGSLTVPGPLRINPVPKDLVDGVGTEADKYWDTIRPPAPIFGDAPPAALAEKPATPPSGGEGGAVPAWTLLLAAAAGALLTLTALRLPALRRQRRKPDPDPPLNEEADTISIPG
ncbi:hypothetical protein ACGFJC_21615 [Nonomuraea fuscirosea]|uniref:hypothetical protein n=1 Tax=Nonomuraea fuscirosea TaxID=1291556 RepID=UPI00343F617D